MTQQELIQAQEVEIRMLKENVEKQKKYIERLMQYNDILSRDSKTTGIDVLENTIIFTNY